MLNKKTQALAVEHPFEQIAFKTVVFLLVAFVALYLYCVSATVLNVIARREALAQSARMETAMGQMEQQYFALSQNVTPEEGARLGLVPLSQPSYVNRPGNVGQATVAQSTI